MSLNLIRYDIFEITEDIKLETVIDSHYSNGNVILELYAHFIDVDKCGPSARIFSPNSTLDQEFESLNTQLCGGFTSLLKSSYQDTLESSSMAKHSSVSPLNYNFGEQSGLFGIGPSTHLHDIL